MHAYDWTVFGYYGGKSTNDGHGFMYCTWFTVNDFGELVPSFF